MRSFMVGMIRYILAEERMHPLTLTVKAQEELGEFAEAMLCEHGHLRYKEIEPDLYSELADTFMVMIAAIAKTDDSAVSPEDIVDKFETALAMKFRKYKEMLEYDKDIPS